MPPRQHRAERTDERLRILQADAARLNTDIRAMTERLEELHTEVASLRVGLARLTTTVHTHVELAITQPATVLAGGTFERARRAQLRAASRSPDPRAAAAAMHDLEQRDREALARYGPPSGAPHTQAARAVGQVGGGRGG